MFWLDEAGADRIVKHNLIRFKADNGTTDSACIFILPEDESVSPYLDEKNTNKKNIKNFPYVKEVVEFMTEFRIPLLLHWNRVITSDDFINIVKLVRIRGKDLTDAMNTILYQDIYDSIHALLIQISEQSRDWEREVTAACYYTAVDFVEPDAQMISYAKRLLGSINESYWNTPQLKRWKSALISYLNQYNKYSKYD